MIKLRLPASRRLRGEGDKEFKPGMIINTTVGRVVFNDILHSSDAVLQLDAAGRSSFKASSRTATRFWAGARRSACSTG